MLVSSTENFYGISSNTVVKTCKFFLWNLVHMLVEMLQVAQQVHIVIEFRQALFKQNIHSVVDPLLFSP